MYSRLPIGAERLVDHKVEWIIQWFVPPIFPFSVLVARLEAFLLLLLRGDWVDGRVLNH